MNINNTAKCNKKRFLDSPPSDSPSKRIIFAPHYQNMPNEPLTESSFRSILDAVLDKKLEAIATKDDVSKMRADVVHLETVIQDHDRRIDKLEWKQRSKNLIFKNIPMRKSYKPYITSLLHNIMDLSHINPRSIFTLNKLSDKNLVIILVEFDSNEEVSEILSRVATLKGSNIAIEKDLNEQERERKGKLLRIRRVILDRANENATTNTKIKVSEKKIKIDNDEFLFNKNQNDFVSTIGEGKNLVLREYLLQKFNLKVDNDYCIASLQQ